MSRYLILPAFVAGMFVGHGDPRGAMVAGFIGGMWAVVARTRRAFR